MYVKNGSPPPFHGFLPPKMNVKNVSPPPRSMQKGLPPFSSFLKVHILLNSPSPNVQPTNVPPIIIMSNLPMYPPVIIMYNLPMCPPIIIMCNIPMCPPIIFNNFYKKYSPTGLVLSFFFTQLRNSPDIEQFFATVCEAQKISICF